MQIAIAVLQGLLIIAFAWYGAMALFSRAMVAEFERYGLARFRAMTGALQMAGSAGLLAGYAYRPLLLFSAGGLAAMMLLGVLVRIRIRDPIHEALPAFALMCLNLVVVFGE